MDRVARHIEQKYEQPVSLSIGEGFEASDKEKLKDTLLRLLPYLEGDYCIAGGIATQAHLAAYSELTIPRRLNDIDLVMRRLEDINPAVSADFLLWHWHPNDNVDGFYAALVDKTNNLKVDIFGWQRFPADRKPAQLEGSTVYIRSSADLLVVYVSAMYRRMTHGMPMIHKQLIDAQALLAIADPNSVEHLWQPLHPNDPITALGALDAVRCYVAENPDCFSEKSANVHLEKCGNCISSEAYRVTPIR
jgi:hypothetical protein